MAAAALLVPGCAEGAPRATPPTSAPGAPTTGPATSSTKTPTDEATVELTGRPTAGLVYYVGARAHTGEQRLFAAPSGVGPGDLLGAVREAMATVPADPDLRTPWGGGFVRTVELVGDGPDRVYRVGLVDDSARTALPGMTGREAELAIQQVVWTLHSVGGVRAPVAFHVRTSPRPEETLLGVPATGPGRTYVAEDPATVLNHVAILAPVEGEHVSGPVAVTGVAESFEATVGIRVTSETGKAVVDWSTQAEQCCGRLWPWRYVLHTADWPAGTYVVEARTDDPVGIADGSDGPEVDTRTIVVG